MLRAIVFWVVAILLEAIVVVALANRDVVGHQVEAEYDLTKGWMGETADSIYEDANSMFHRVFVTTEVMEMSYRIFVPDANKPEPEDSFSIQTFRWVRGRIDGLWAVVLRALQRFALFCAWLPYALPVLVPAAVDGWNQRLIKRETFGYTSPVRFHAASYVVISLVFLPVFYMFVPMTVHPMIIPLWSILGGVSVVILTSNVQKVI
jgi:hypothetical protein